MRKRKIIFLSAVILLVGIHFWLGNKSIMHSSPTYDEPVHLTAGYIYWKTGQYEYNGLHHPAFSEMWSALPLVLMSPKLQKFHPAWARQKWGAYDQYQFADHFYYKNEISGDLMLQSGRRMQLTLSSFLGLLIGLCGYILGGHPAGLLALGFWAFSPTVLAHGTLVTTDFSFAVFYFSFFVSLMWWSRRWGPMLTGLFLGLCAASKYFVAAIFPALFVTLFWVWWTHRKDGGIRFLTKRNVIQIFVACGGALLVLLAVYRFGGIETYLEGFKQIVSRAQTGRSSFFMGQHGTQGWIHYFPMVFLMKTPVSILLGLAGVIGFVVFKKFRLPTYLWIPPLVFFVLACFSKVQIGHRYILVLYPFLFLILGLGLGSLPRRWRWIGSLFLMGLFVETWAIQPHYLSFFNALFGGPEKGYTHLTDSSVDWGQGLKELSENLSEEDKKNGIYLSYFGVADPHFYGLRYLDVGSDVIAGHKDDSGRAGLKPQKLAISVTNLQATYYADKEIFKWLKEKEPVKRIGYSLFLYDFKDDSESLKRLENMRKMVSPL